MSDGLPDLLTVDEAARVLRIKRTLAYQLAKRDLETGGGEGLHVLRIGRLLRVPRSALEELIGGPITWPSAGPRGATVPRTRRRRSSASRDQAALPFE